MIDPKNGNLVVEGPGGIKVSAKGPYVVGFLVGLVLVGCLAYLLNQHDTKTAAGEKLLAEQQVHLQEGLSEMIYIMSLTEQERKALGVTMPESLRRKLRN